MRLGISSGAFPSLDPLALLCEASCAGFEGVEWRTADTSLLTRSLPSDYRTNNHATVPPNLSAMQHLRRESAEAGLAVVGLSPYLTVGDVDAAIETLDLAMSAGTDRVRLWAPRITCGSYASALGEFRAFLKALVPEASARGVRLAVEIHHGTICPSVALTMRAIAGFDAAHVGVIYDVGNLAVEGYEDPRIALELLGPHLCHVQVKNARFGSADDLGFRWAWCPLDSGVLPLRAILAEIQAFGFDGWLCCEDFSVSGGAPLPADEVRKLNADKYLLDTMLKASQT